MDELKTSCPACRVLVRFAVELAGSEQPCPSCRRPMFVAGERVPVGRAHLDAPGFNKQGEVEPRGLSGFLFGGGLLAGVAGITLAVYTKGIIWKFLLFTSGASMVIAWIMTRKLPPRRRDPEA